MSHAVSSYVENANLASQTVHDADSHVMELPTKIVDYFEQSYLDDFAKYANKAITVTKDLDVAVNKHDDPDFRANDEAQLLLRKNHLALGSFRKEDRPQCLDLLGFTSQLVFTTAALGNYGLDDTHPSLAGQAARAHNRMNADFCSVDKRLLATGYVPLSDIETAPAIAQEAINLGCKGLIIPSKCPSTHSPTHIGFDSIWAMAEEAGIPILFHVGGETKMPAAYTENGLPKVKDFHGGDENFTGLSFMTIPLAVWQTMAAFVFDGVLSRFPNLMFGAIELGAGWLPSWMQFLDSGFEAFRKGEERLQKLQELPSEIVKQQFRVTPYAHEPTGWITQNTSPDMLLFSSDFPHVEGGRNPLKRFEDNMPDLTDADKRKFYRDNFISLMGNGLDQSLRDHPSAL
ncbi:MAG: amidohydrolase family protein [Pseudomonadales bacterium]|nr:amidohydrolase family protein [Pseudomonadales bacterium]